MQKILENILFVTQYFMGIGSGSSVASSGETSVFNLIKNKKPIIFDVGANQGQFAKEAMNEIDGGLYTHLNHLKKLLIL